MRNRLPAAAAAAVDDANLDFPFPALSATTRPNLELGRSGVARPLPTSSPPLALGLSPSRRRASDRAGGVPRAAPPTFGANDDARRACFTTTAAA